MRGGVLILVLVFEFKFWEMQFIGMIGKKIE